MSVLWQSFDYPCDTLVPTKKLGFNHKTGHHWFLVAWFTKSLATPGAFSLEWEPMAQELSLLAKWETEEQ
uniref:Serine/threonine-protein kinase receptor n=1 Tax=Cajanus cajan TaxID=3821 RepID=A0A151R8Q2_CAJCA|nr:Putative serine/threonine-protein kinase receptor [Cajanus cajan]KYP39007.1 Putative serine/threonine-protein kinase receptor [Cajanus cajan]KYP39008.1 Putative serine/threonine-protein kinase receptor [Cajanus cajan]